MISFILFDAATLQQAGQNILGLFGIGAVGMVSVESIYYVKSYWVTFMIAAIGATPLPGKIYEMILKYPLGKKVMYVAETVFVAGLFIVITAFLVDGSFNPFLYFRF